jgi:hypothetical protein
MNSGRAKWLGRSNKYYIESTGFVNHEDPEKITALSFSG